MTKLLRYIYQFTHDLLFNTIDINPFFIRSFYGKKIRKGHISEEHLQNPLLDEELAEGFKQNNIEVTDLIIEEKEYREYLQQANYPETYYGGGPDKKSNFTEKTLEHYVSSKFIEFNAETVYIDIAAGTSPFYKIVEKLYNVKEIYRQDLIFKKGIHGNRIGGLASEIPLPDESVDAVTLHCSLEHFEGDSDIRFFREMERILKEGGKIIILPFYLAHEYTIHVDPIYNFLKFHYPDLDPKANLRYCNWYQYFSRHYDIPALKERILNRSKKLKLKICRVTNFKEIDPSCYLRFVGVFEKI